MVSYHHWALKVNEILASLLWDHSLCVNQNFSHCHWEWIILRSSLSLFWLDLLYELWNAWTNVLKNKDRLRWTIFQFWSLHTWRLFKSLFFFFFGIVLVNLWSQAKQSDVGLMIIPDLFSEGSSYRVMTILSWYLAQGVYGVDVRNLSGYSKLLSSLLIFHTVWSLIPRLKSFE